MNNVYFPYNSLIHIQERVQLCSVALLQVLKQLVCVDAFMNSELYRGFVYSKLMDTAQCHLDPTAGEPLRSLSIDLDHSGLRTTQFFFAQI